MAEPTKHVVRPSRVPLLRISSRAYEHPADRTALTAMRAVPGFDVVLRTMSGFVGERSLRLLHLASAVRVSDRQLRGVHAAVVEGARILDLPRTPEVFVVHDPRMVAMTLGLDEPFVVLSTGLIDMLDEDELRFVVGHELGHVLSGHAVYGTMLYQLAGLATRMAWLPLGRWGVQAVVVALEEWARKAELSCDRAGLLAGQDPAAALRAQMKMAGGSRFEQMDADAFLAQATEYDGGGDLRDGVIKVLQLRGQRHPFAALRAAELHRWAGSGELQRILSGDYPRRDDDRDAVWRDDVAEALRTYRDGVRSSGDPLLRVVRDIGDGVGDAGQRLWDRVRPQ
jgi:Zn-dependent protease with chaperone function